MSNSTAPLTTGQAAPTGAETALQGRIADLKSVSDRLHADLLAYGSGLGAEAATARQQLSDAIATHADSTDAFCNAAKACVPPIRG